VASWSTASHLSKSEDVAELRTLFEGDNSDADEDECRVMKVKRSSSTLDAVKSQLRKHLSCESALSKHRTRSTVGNSEEEIQRRKELRLIRDRRIKEELSSKGAYDDTKSLSTLATENSPHMEPWPRIRNEDMYSSNPLEVAPTLLLLARKSADEFYVRKPSPISAIQRRHSLAVLDKPERLIRTTTDCDTYRSSSDFSIPPAPILKLQRLPSIVDPATRRTSWRLSFTSNQRAIQLRALSQDHELSVASATRGTLASPLRWFRGQGIGAPPFSTVKIPDLLSAPDNPPSQAVFYPELVHYEGVDGDAEQLTAPISLLDMRISQRLASRGLHSHSSSPQLSSWGSHSHYRARSRNSEASNQKETSQSRHHDSESNSVMSDSKISTNWGDVLRDGISSIYSSTGNCAKHVSESSRFSVPSLLAHNKRQVSLQSDELQGKLNAFVRWHCMTDLVVNSAAPQAPPIIVTTATATDVNRSADSHGIPSSRHDHRYAIKSPILVSETLSFREREAELDKIKIRFPKSMEKLGQTSSVRSKFNEDFGGKQTPPPTVAQKNPSLSMVLQLPRLAKLVSRSYDGANPFEFQVPGRQGFGYTFSNSSRSTGGTVSLSSRSPATEMPGSPARDPLQPHGDDAEGIWAQALKWTQEEFQSQLATESSPMKKDLSDHHGSFLAIGNVSRRLKGKGKASMDSLKDVNVVRLLNEGMDIQLKRELRQQARKVETERAKAHEWADELKARERQAKAKTAAVGKGPFLPCAKMPPESWARFPSHNREERTASAGLPDHVSSKDFAIKDMRDGVIEWMTSDRKHHHHHHHKKEQHHSLPMRLSRQIRTSLYKLRTTKSMATGDAIHGRKGSVSVGGKLEFPELEIIAGEIAGEGLYEEVERETAEVMRRDERVARMVVFGEGGIDGEVDSEGNMTVLELGETSEISIADPRFYDDCITLPLEEDAEIDNHS
jgi:hypothetical protein